MIKECLSQHGDITLVVSSYYTGGPGSVERPGHLPEALSAWSGGGGVSEASTASRGLDVSLRNMGVW